MSIIVVLPPDTLVCGPLTILSYWCCPLTLCMVRITISLCKEKMEQVPNRYQPFREDGKMERKEEEWEKKEKNNLVERERGVP